MANFFSSPNMNLSVPVVGVDPGPDWANNLNASLTILDAHTHSPGSGVQVTPSGLNINADLAFGSNNATLLRTVRFVPQSAALTGASDLGCLYEVGNDLYYNSGAGAAVQITNGSSIVGAGGTITGLPSGTASASYSSVPGTFVFQKATSTAANMDIATLILRYPGSYPTPSGNYIAIQAPTSLASGYSLTLPATTPAANNSLIGFSTSGIGAYVNTDNSTLVIASNTIKVATSGITANEIAALTITGAKIANATITGGKLVNATITTTQIASGTILGSNIDSATVSGSNIVSSVHLAGNGVTIAGQSAMVSAPAATAYYRASVGLCSAGGSSTGAGWAQSGSGGNYTVTFSGGDVFSVAPLVTITVIAAGGGYAHLTAEPSTSSFSYSTRNTSGFVAALEVCFIAIGYN